MFPCASPGFFLLTFVYSLGLFMRTVTVEIPATTSNLGPGYDCLGVALGAGEPRDCHPGWQRRGVADGAGGGGGVF